jgi:hypothetical protein
MTDDYKPSARGARRKGRGRACLLVQELGSMTRRALEYATSAECYLTRRYAKAQARDSNPSTKVRSAIWQPPASFL